MDASQAGVCDEDYFVDVPDCQRIPLKESHISNNGREDPKKDADDYLGKFEFMNLLPFRFGF